MDEEWAQDGAHPTVNAVNINFNGFDENLFQDPQWAFANEIKGQVPRSYKEAMHNPARWMSRMSKEMQQLVDKGLYMLEHLPAGEHTINGMWVFSLKIDGAGNEIKTRAQYCAHGDEEEEDCDYGKK